MEWTTRINWIDVVAIIIIMRSTYIGSQRGFFGELFFICGFFLTIIFSLHFYGSISNFLNTYLFIPLKFSDLIGFLIIGIIIYMGFSVVYGFLQKIMKIELLPPLNKVGGPLLGFCRGFVIVTILFMLMLLVPISYIIESAQTKSLLGPFFIRTGAALYRKTVDIIPFAQPKDLSELLSGAEPLEFKMFTPKKKTDEEEALN